MQRLKASVYLKNNKRRALIIIISFGLFFFLIYAIRFFMFPSCYMDEVICVKSAEQMQVAYMNSFTATCKDLDESLWEENSGATYEDMINELNRAGKVFLDELRGDVDNSLIYLCNVCNIRIKSFIGNSTFYAPMVDQEEFKEIVDFMDIEVSEGRMPEAPGEIIVDERMLRNLERSVGDTLYSDNTIIVGTTKTKYFFAAGIDYENSEYSNRYLFFINDGVISDLKAFFEKYDIDADVQRNSAVQILADRVNASKTVQRFKDELDIPLGVMTYSIMVVLAITLYFVYRLHIQDRYSEWCLYRSLGYSSKEVFFLAFREYIICLFFSIILATILSIGICFAGGQLMESKGMIFKYVIPDTLYQLIGISVLLTGIMQLPVVGAMRRVRTIDAMEDDYV